MPSDSPRRAPGPYVASIIGRALREATERSLLRHVREAAVPKHLAIIMDGNRRFASQHGLLVGEGHEHGKQKLEELLDWCLDVGIKVLTVFALSTENFRRPESELRPLMDLFEQSFRDIVTDERVHRYQIRVRALGNRQSLPPRVREAIDAAEAATKDYNAYLYNVAIAYGGREEIVQAVRHIAESVRDGKLDVSDINERRVADALYTADLPDPDLVFRTSGEERISNFLLWQAAYSELYFTDVLWPGLTRLDFLRAIRTFQERRRRFGE